MEFKQTKTARGFKLITFKDDYNEECSLQESSSVEPHIWLGIEDANPQILVFDAKRLGISTNEDCGWVPYEVPKEVSMTTRMHLTPKQAKELAKKLLKFARYKHL